MRVSVTNKNLNFPENAILEDASLVYDAYDIYVGYMDGIRVAISREDGAIILEGADESN